MNSPTDRTKPALMALGWFLLIRCKRNRHWISSPLSGSREEHSSVTVQCRIRLMLAQIRPMIGFVRWLGSASETEDL
jgi:hypothetical protein